MSDEQYIFRQPVHKRPYTSVDNETICDDRLSWRARGLLIFLLSKPPNWKVMVSHLAEQSPKDGKAAVMAGLQELQEYGYLVKRPRAKQSGRFNGFDVLLYEIPDGTASDLTTRTATDLPSTVNRTLQKKEIQNNDLEKKEENFPISDLSDYRDRHPCFERESLATVLPMKRNRKRLDSPVLQD